MLGKNKHLLVKSHQSRWHTLLYPGKKIKPMISQLKLARRRKHCLLCWKKGEREMGSINGKKHIRIHKSIND